MKITGYHHVGLRVSDMERSLKFYTEGLGGKVLESFPMASTGAMIYMVELAPGAVVELLPGGADDAEQNAKWAHICINTDDAEAAYEQALRAGATSRTAPNKASRDKFTRINAFVIAPGGELIELYQIVES